MIVAIVGAESTGKSTLARELAQKLQGVHVGEVLREWCDREGRTPQAHEQRAITDEQRRRLEAAAMSHTWVVADTVPLMTAVYSDLLFGDLSLYNEALSWHAQHVTATLLTALDLPWHADGQRDGAHVREPVDGLIRRALESLNLPYAVVHGTGMQRMDAALSALRRWLPTSPADDNPGFRFRLRCIDCLDPSCEQQLHRKQWLPR